MGKRKDSKCKPQSWEAIGHWLDPAGNKQKDTYCVFWESMLRSEAFSKLTPRQIVLYMICKAQTKGKHRPRQDVTPQEAAQIELTTGASVKHDRVFYLSWDTAKQYTIYSDKASQRRLFERDMKQLHRVGLIEKLRQGANHHSKTIYRLSNEWRKWDGLE